MLFIYQFFEQTFKTKNNQKLQDTLEITSFSDINSIKTQILSQIIIATIFEDYNLIEALRELEDEGKIKLVQDKDQNITSYQIL